MKLWQKKSALEINERIEIFSIGLDQIFDQDLARFDILGSLAHAIQLESIGLLTKTELNDIQGILKDLLNNIENFVIDKNHEDIHSQIEAILTEKLGQTGMKIHSGRSRNDQVLVDIKLYLRAEIENIAKIGFSLFESLQAKSEEFKSVLLPGYTHLQIAMPSSFGLWFGAYAEALIDDFIQLKASFDIINRNPLGSGAGYGSSFPLNRSMTTELLGFESLNYNVVYAQMTRGKAELAMAQSISTIASTVSRFCMDVCMYNSQNFGYLILPESFTTGSSIMPHKKNPDVAELLRGKTNILKGLPNELMLLQSNLPSGYHREFQLTKELLFPAINTLKECIEICTMMVNGLKVKNGLLDDPKYDVIFSVENVNKEVINGLPFREAYRKVGLQIEAGEFIPLKDLNHTLEGSIGNLCNEEITTKMNAIVDSFAFDKIQKAFDQLMA